MNKITNNVKNLNWKLITTDVNIIKLLKKFRKVEYEIGLLEKNITLNEKKLNKLFFIRKNLEEELKTNYCEEFIKFLYFTTIIEKNKEERIFTIKHYSKETGGLKIIRIKF